MKKTIICLFFLGLFAVTGIDAQTVIQGTVFDRTTREPIPGASVVIQSTATGIATDLNGAFLITSRAELPVTLFVSFLGYESQEIDVYDASLPIDVYLSDAKNYLDEVVVTALGQKRKRSALPYAVQEVNGAELNRGATSNFTSDLAGKVAGLQITSANTLGGSTNVILRGFKSLTQSNQALFVVDGVPLDNSNHSNGYDLGNAISDVNPNDVEQISVLKGAAASALYGSRAANGVILIKTKEGKKNKSLGITINSTSQFGSYDKSTTPAYQREYGQGNGSAGTAAAAYPDYYFATKKYAYNNNEPVQVVYFTSDMGRGAPYDPNKLVYTWESFIPGNPNFHKATPWVAANDNEMTDLLETPYTFVNSIILDKATDNGSFKLGYTNSDEKGGLPNSYLRKNTVNFSSSYNLSKYFTAGGSFNYISEDSKNRNGYSYQEAGTLIGALRAWWPSNISIGRLRDEYFRTKTNAAWMGMDMSFAGTTPLSGFNNNFYWQLYEDYNTNTRDRYYGNVYFTVKPIENLEVTARASRDHYAQLFEKRINVGSAFTSSYSRYDYGVSENNFDLLASYDKQWGSDWNTKALIGGNIRRNQSTSLYATTNGGLVVPDIFALSNSVNTPAAPVETDVRKGVNSVFGNITLDYQNWAVLDATLRRDESSTLPENNNSYYYPSLSGNILFSHFLPNQKWLDYGKVKLNYAEVGNDAPPYSLYSTYVANTALNGQPVTSVNATWNNSNLKPEKTQSFEFGLEAAFLNNRLGFDVTYYSAKTSEQLTPITPSAASGYAAYYVNGGAIQNKGVEAVLNATPIKTKNFSWNINVNWSKNNNEVLSLYAGQPSYTILNSEVGQRRPIQLVAEVGKPYGVIKGTDYEYKEEQILIDANGYPVIASELKEIGNINPDWIGGISNRFSYKNFSLGFLIDIKSGGDVYSSDLDLGSSSGILPETAGLNANGAPVRAPLSEGGGYLFKGVTADGQANTKYVDASDAKKSLFPFGSTYSGNFANSSYVYDASYVKLRELSISYNLPKRLLKKLKVLNDVNLSLIGHNLWIIHKNLPYADPEEGQASGNASIGYQTAAYPSVRTFAFNIQLKF
ncbi:MAG: SusC/RagA family TonB-linked outer membrane protein [Dysgonamonadaceae bacterium]|jgi:TonB-linked SusC/RagA family outer membrane protein|nr:SusC/RagA family TonB-linked outer membrane protein [Dysgonamonadaceae bacterium]